jgi:hypothetical protein
MRILVKHAVDKNLAATFHTGHTLGGSPTSEGELSGPIFEETIEVKREMTAAVPARDKLLTHVKLTTSSVESPRNTASKT